MLKFFTIDGTVGYAHHTPNGWRFDRELHLDGIVESLHDQEFCAPPDDDNDHRPSLPLNLTDSQERLERWLPFTFRSPYGVMCTDVPDNYDVSKDPPTVAKSPTMSDKKYAKLLLPHNPNKPTPYEVREQRIRAAILYYRKNILAGARNDR